AVMLTQPQAGHESLIADYSAPVVSPTFGEPAQQWGTVATSGVAHEFTSRPESEQKLQKDLAAEGEVQLQQSSTTGPVVVNGAVPDNWRWAESREHYGRKNSGDSLASAHGNHPTTTPATPVVTEGLGVPDKSDPLDNRRMYYTTGKPAQKQTESAPTLATADELNKPARPVARPESAAPPAIVGLAIDGELRRKAKDLNELSDLEQQITSPDFESYQPIVENGFVSPTTQPLSTFSIDVDTASYANVRRFLTHNHAPPPAAVRMEELINYFHYEDPQPVEGVPFSVNCDVGACPWQVDHRLVRINLQGKEITRERRPATNLVFLVDVSGSMAAENKLPLVKSSLQMLTEQLDESDRIAIVTYAGTSGVLLDSITGDHRQTIMNAIGSLQSGGSTNGASGIQLAYTTAVNHFIEGGSNRVILCTDGDFNVGVTDDDQLVEMIQTKAKTGVFLSVFGFGMGNLKDGKLEKLADKGNGHYGYIDSLREAQKVFVEELFGTLVTIAKDVKIQVEFNPAQVNSYRLLGYENRVMAAKDFHDDTKDAGEIGAGHSVTALYEYVPANGAKAVAAGVEKLKYQAPVEAAGVNTSAELLTVKLRYKQPTADKSSLIEQAVVDPHNARPSQNLQWASAVAAFGLTLRQSAHRGQASFALAKELAQGAVGTDKAGHRHEFIGLIDRAAQICNPTPVTTQPAAGTPE
ncbi:MAG TPA: VWA domain-containing protein, partial [Planctomycetaceae bacterium]|nr:VWA domain-containing protein [Planctomycetaceae bacterium]